MKEPTWLKSIGSEAAIALAATKWWEGKPPREAALFALQTRELCLPMEEFYRLLHDALGRPVYTHEIALDAEGLRLELLGERDAPSFDDILALIPFDKRIAIQADQIKSMRENFDPDPEPKPLDITVRLEQASAEWRKCEECIDSAASIRLADLLAEAGAEIKRLRG